MTNFESLLIKIENSDDMVYVESTSTKNPAKTIRDDKLYGIFLNERAYNSDAERFVALAHEKGHCDTGAVYTTLTPLITKEQCETKAWRSSVYEHITLNALIDAFEDGCTNVYELANHFGFTEDFMRHALELYEQDLRRIWQERHGEG